MEKYPHLEKAPITEALIDFRVSLPQKISLEKLGEIGAKIEKRYPTKENLFQYETNISYEEGKPSVSEAHKQIGFRYFSEDKKFVFSPTIEGFTLSRLEPYETWEKLKQDGFELWKIYKKTAKPLSISRVALRYINLLRLPINIRDFKDYLTAPPDVPPRLPQTLNGFFSRIIIPIEKLDATAVIALKTDTVAKQTSQEVIFDIDIFKNVDFNGNGDDAWKLTEFLRVEKNKIFFESITEKMEELCR